MPEQEAAGCRRECRSLHQWKEQPPLTKEEEEPEGPSFAAGPEAPFARSADGLIGENNVSGGTKKGALCVFRNLITSS